MSRKDKRKGDERDQRRYSGPWRGRDRRRVAPAVLGGLSLLLPGNDAAATPEATDFATGREPPGSDVVRGGRALAGMSLYVPSNESAAAQIRAWRQTRPEDARLLERIVSQPSATWFGDWNGDVRRDADRLVTAAARAGAAPVIVAYNIPNRDCNQYSSGGVGSPEEYRGWIGELAAGIGARDAVVVLEPDATALVTCLTPEGQAERFSLIREAVEVLKSESNARVYIDAGHAHWVPDDEMARRLHLSGVERADGFALNVSNFIPTDRNTEYGERVARRLSNAHFVIDTSRNGGAVEEGEWCNPSGASLGESPTTATDHPLLDALLWVKRPGESDGECNGGPAAGQWWGEYALGLARGSTGPGPA